MEYNGSLTFDKQLAKWNDIQEIYGMGYSGAFQPLSHIRHQQQLGSKGR